jgi:hypothetical protein
LVRSRVPSAAVKAKADNTMRVAVEGCAHGELQKIYDTIAFMEKKEKLKIDLLLICGDFQVGFRIPGLSACSSALVGGPQRRRPREFGVSGEVPQDELILQILFGPIGGSSSDVVHRWQSRSQQLPL